MDPGLCWMCNSDYTVKGGESVTTGSVRLRNKQRGSAFASNGSLSRNAFAVHSLFPLLFLPFSIQTCFFS
jgi:hypothetical protein